MNLSLGYLTQKQQLIWSLKKHGLSEAGIARKLAITRQTVHYALDRANQKVCESLEEAANINKIEIQTIDSAKGYLVGQSHHFKTQAFITFSSNNGIQVWYKHEGNCEKCTRLKKCREILIEEAKDRKLPLQEKASDMLPSKLAEILFQSITGEQNSDNT